MTIPASLRNRLRRYYKEYEIPPYSPQKLHLEAIIAKADITYTARVNAVEVNEDLAVDEYNEGYEEGDTAGYERGYQDGLNATKNTGD